MANDTENHIHAKKLNKPTTRELTPALLFLRAMQLGLTYEEAFNEEVGFLNDLMIEKSNDSYDYPTVGSDVDFKKL